MLAALLAIASSLEVEPAWACGLPQCRLGRFHPSGSDVPGNLPAFRWWPEYGLAAPDYEVPRQGELSLARLEDGGAVSVPITLDPCRARREPCLIRPAGLLSPGTYRLAAASACAPDGGLHYTIEPAQAHLNVVEAAPMPTALGVLSVRNLGFERLWTYNAWGCPAAMTTVRLDVTLRLHESMRPWRRAMQIEIGGNSLGFDFEGADPMVLTATVRALCAAAWSFTFGVMPAGPYQLRATATLPGGALFLASNTIAGEASCDGAPNPWPDGGAAHYVFDAGLSEGGRGSAAPSKGCASAGAHGATWACWALVLALLLQRRGRRSEAPRA